MDKTIFLSRLGPVSPTLQWPERHIKHYRSHCSVYKITVELPASNELKTETFGNISDKKVKGINNEDFEVLDLNSIDATGKIELNHISKGKLTKEAKVKHHQIWMNLL